MSAAIFALFFYSADYIFSRLVTVTTLRHSIHRILAPSSPLDSSSVSGLQIDPDFEQLCLSFKFQHETTRSCATLSESPSSVDISDKHRLIRNYHNAWKDFYPSKARCVYKSGPAWEVREGPEEQGIRREPRTVCRPDIAPGWSAALKKIMKCLDDLGVDQTCINAFAWANEGDKKPFCPLLLTVGVRPKSLAYQLPMPLRRSLVRSISRTLE